MPKTGIEEGIEETKKLLEEANTRETKELENEIAEEPAEKVDEPVPEVKPEEKSTEEPEVKPPHQHAAERRAKRKEAEDLKEQLAAANARIVELTKPREETRAEPVEVVPDKLEDPVAHAEYVARQAVKEAATARAEVKEVRDWKAQQQQIQNAQNTKNEALAIIGNYESEVRAKDPHYDDAKRYYAQILATSVKALNPNVTNQQLSSIVEQRMISRVAELERDYEGNPVEHMISEAKSWGFKPPTAAEKEIKPDFDKVARNRARNAGTVAAAAGTGQGEVTPRFAATEMTTAEIGEMFAKMGPQEKKNFYKQIGG